MVQGTGPACPTSLGICRRLSESLPFVMPQTRGYRIRPCPHRRRSPGTEDYGTRDTVTVAFQLMRRPVHQPAGLGAMHLDGLSWLCERIKVRVKVRVIETVHRRQDLPGATMLARKRGRLLSCVVGTLSRMMVTLAHHSGMYIYLCCSLCLSGSGLPFLHPPSHVT